MKHSLLALTFLYCSVVQAYEDTWTSPDKAKHYAASFGIGFATEVIFEDRVNIWTRFAIAMSPGVLKEVTDRNSGGVFSGKDLAWDALGAISGMYLGTVMIQKNGFLVKIPFN